MATGKFVPAVTEVKVITPAKVVLELSEEEAKQLRQLMGFDMTIPQTLARAGLWDYEKLARLMRTIQLALPRID